jgi:hypothetical protein
VGDVTELEPMRDHWWWRPGWRVGRSFYTWHVTFANQPAAHQLASDYTPVLAKLPMLDPIPVRWLHLTTQGIDHVPEPADGFRPHVSLAYSNSAGPAEPLATALAAHTGHTAEVVVSSVSLIDLNRDRKTYEWTDVATVQLRSSER